MIPTLCGWFFFYKRPPGTVMFTFPPFHLTSTSLRLSVCFPATTLQ